MAKKKKKREDDAWMWMSQPVLPGMVSLEIVDPLSIFARYGYIEGPARRITGTGAIRSSYIEGDTSIEEMPIEGFTRAMFEYAYLAALDPTNIPEARAWAIALGVGYGTGMLVTLAKGLIIGPPILAAIDPQDRWEGGLDETVTYQKVEEGLQDPQGFFTGAWPAFSLGALT